MQLDERKRSRPTKNFSERAEVLLALTAERVERFSQNRMRVDLVSAFAAGLCVSGLVWVISTSSGDELPVMLNIKTTLVAVAAYTAAALLLQRVWRGLLRRILPNWIMVAVLGSLFFIIIEIVPIKIGLWNDQRTRVMWSDTTQFITEELEGARLFYIFLCCITLPVTAMVYYAGSICRAVRRWYNDSGKPPSILGSW